MILWPIVNTTLESAFSPDRCFRHLKASALVVLKGPQSVLERFEAEPAPVTQLDHVVAQAPCEEVWVHHEHGAVG